MINPKDVQIGLTSKQSIVSLYGQPERKSEQFGCETFVYPGKGFLTEIIGFDTNNVVLFFSCIAIDHIKPSVSGRPLRYFSEYAHDAKVYAFNEKGYTLTVTSGDIVVSILYHKCMDAKQYEDFFGKFYPVENPFLD